MSTILSERLFIVAITALLAVATVVHAEGQQEGEETAGEPEFGDRYCGICDWIIHTSPDGIDENAEEGIGWFSDADAQDFDLSTYNIFRSVWNYEKEGSRIVRWVNGGIGVNTLRAGKMAYVCHSGLFGYTPERGNIYYKGNNDPEETTAFRGTLEEQKVLDLSENKNVIKLHTKAGITDWTADGGFRACEGHQRIQFTSEIIFVDDGWVLRYLLENQSCDLIQISVPGMGTSSFQAGDRRQVAIAVSDAPKAGCVPVTFGSNGYEVTADVPTFVPDDWAGCPDEDQ